MSATARPVRRQPRRSVRAAPRLSPADRVARGRRRRRVAIAVVALAGIAGVLWLLLGTSLLGARRVQVEGTVELSDRQVRTAARVPLGTPLLLLDTAAIESRVQQQLRRVAHAQVSRSVTGTVHIAVSERTPVAVAPAEGDAVALVDATATSYALVAAPPPDLPELRVPRVSPTAPAARAAVQVLTELPPALLERVELVSARSPADVVLRLRDDREVHWGGPTRTERKAAVLGPLLTQPGDVFDVSSPSLPTIS